jgi:predicted  nucleic acid-binding Zn-ribbon protein
MTITASGPRMQDSDGQVALAVNDTAAEIVRLRRRVGDLEERLDAVELTASDVVELGTLELTRMAHHYQLMLTAVVMELHARHLGIAEEVRAPQIRALEEELAEAKQDAWRAHHEAHELGQENRRLRSALAAERAVPSEAAS